MQLGGVVGMWHFTNRKVTDLALQAEAKSADGTIAVPQAGLSTVAKSRLADTAHPLLPDFVANDLVLGIREVGGLFVTMSNDLLRNAFSDSGNGCSQLSRICLFEPSLDLRSIHPTKRFRILFRLCHFRPGFRGCAYTERNQCRGSS